MIYFIVIILALLLVSATLYYIFVTARLKHFNAALDLLMERGKKYSWYKFTHIRSARSLMFVKDVVGGVKTISLVMDDLRLSEADRRKLLGYIESAGLRTASAKIKSKERQLLVLGSSPKRAAEIANSIAIEILGFSRLTRFFHYFEGIDLTPRP